MIPENASGNLTVNAQTADDQRRRAETINAALAALRESGWKPDAVGGLTLGADPVSYAIAYASALAATPIRAFTVRKEAKAHGTGKLIEGPFRAGTLVNYRLTVHAKGLSASVECALR